MLQVKGLNQSDEIMEVALEDYEILSFHEEKVLRFYHLFTLKSGTPLTVVTEFVGPAELSADYDHEVQLERLFVSGGEVSLSLDDSDSFRALIEENIQSMGGFLSLIHRFIDFHVQPEFFGQQVTVKPVQADMDDCYASIVHFSVSGISQSLSLTFLTDCLPETLEEVKTKPRLPIGIADPRESTDVPMAYISDYLDKTQQAQLTEAIRQPLIDVLTDALSGRMNA